MNQPSSQRRTLPTAEQPEVRILCGARQRFAGKLDLAVDDPPDDPPLDQVVAAARKHVGADGWLLAGGEPTLRADFPQLIKALVDAGAPDLGVVTDGLALASPKVAGMLAQLGLKRVRVRVASARSDAHDWLMGQEGSWKRAVLAVKAAVAAGLHAEVEVPVSRPTRPYLPEAVELFAGLGASAVVLRRVTGRGPAEAHDVAVLARLGLVQKELEAAVQAGVRRGLRMVVEGFPLCAAPGVRAHHLATDAVVWAVPASAPWPFLASHFEAVGSDRGCAHCPGAPACCRAPLDYIRRHGRTEIDSESNVTVNPGKLPPTPLAGGDTRPPPRAGRHPTTRRAYVQRMLRLPSHSGDPLIAVRGQPVDAVLRTVFVAPARVADRVLGDHPGPTEPETTRAVRVRLVKAAQMGARTLRIASAGSLAHPAAAELLREATRLEFPVVEVAGEGSGLDGFSDMQLRRLRGITRLDVALYGPDAASHDAIVGVEGAFDAALRATDRLANLVPKMRVGCYAVLTSEEHLAAFAEAWDMGDLPGDPWFRLAPRGGSLTRLAGAASELPAGPARDAIAAVLPCSLFERGEVMPAPEAQDAWGDLPSSLIKPSGSDRFGCYTERPSRDQGLQPGDCPGVAQGWTVD